MQWVKPLNLSNQYDAYAIMAYAAESKSRGLGATSGVGFGFTTAGQVDVSANFRSSKNFTSVRADHSGQFNGAIMARQDY